ncbi:DUF664 domain-containing protein [Streptomyces sp. SID14478]|nr:DUF664 domain-containing protein [Streptomyces sp. SID14478]
MRIAVDFPLPHLLDDCAEQSTCYRELVAGSALDAQARRTVRDGLRVDLRWILLHLTEETARHNGHLDTLREMLDGTTVDRAPSGSCLRRPGRGAPGCDRRGCPCVRPPPRKVRTTSRPGCGECPGR